MERPFGPGSSQDGEGEADEDMDQAQEAPPPPSQQNGAIPHFPEGSILQGGPFLDAQMQAARMHLPVTEHQVVMGNVYTDSQHPMGHPFPNANAAYYNSSIPQPYYPPPYPHQHPNAQNGHYHPQQQPNGVPFLAPAPPFPPPIQHDHLDLPPAPLQSVESPPVDEASLEDGRPKRDRAKRDFFSAGSHSGSAGPSEDGAGSSRKGKEKERSHHSHHHDGTARKKKQEPTGHKRVKVIKRDVPADLECSFCEGDKTANRDGRPEDMVACYTCGRAGHPTCLQMSSKRLVAMVMSYDWRCIECKPCEICKQKGDDEKILFCDKCDRGTHYDCLDPPLTQPPDGSWACGKCLPLRHAPAQIEQPRPPKPKHPNQYTNRPPQPNQYSQPTPSTSKRAPQPNQYSRPSSSRLYSPDEYQAHTVSKRAVPRVSYRQDADEYEEDEDEESPPPLPPRIKLRLKRQRAESEEEDDDDDVTSKLPFGGVLSGKDADTSRSKIGVDDKDRFERSRKAAEAKLGGPRPPTRDPYASMPSTPQAFGSPSPSGYYNNSPSTSYTDLSFPAARPLRDQLLTSQTQDHHLYPRRSQDPSTPGPSSSSSFNFNSNSNAPAGGSSNGEGGGPSAFEKIKCIRFGPFDIDTWYTAPYPEEYAVVPDGRLWICEFCLKYMKSAFGAGRHRLKCKARHPPGDEVYRDGAVSVFEVDGRKNKIYCQNLCLLAKMFLDHKTLYYDVEPFLFYIMTETDDFGARFVGYFSKEKRSPMNYNVSCIMTLPVRQRKGWGNLLIDFSYLLSKKEARVGSPEKPLSDLGLLSYTNYWTVTLFFYLRTAQSPVTIEAISKATFMTAEDILFVLKAKNMITIIQSSPPPSSLSRKSSSKNVPSKARGSHSTTTVALSLPLNPRGAAVHTAETDRVTQANFIPQTYTIQWDRDEVERYLEKFEGKGWLRLRPDNLKWTAFTDSLALRALKKKKEKVSVEEVGERLMGVMEGEGGAGVGVGGEVVSEAVGAAEGEGGAVQVGAEEGGEEAVPMVVVEEPALKEGVEEAVVENEIAPPPPLEDVPEEDASIPAADPQPEAGSSGSTIAVVDFAQVPQPSTSTSSSVVEPSSLISDQPSSPSSHAGAPPPPLPASPNRARRSQSSQLAPPPPSNPASKSDDPATLALVAALTSPNRRLRSSSASPSKHKPAENGHAESSPRKRSTRNTSAGLGGEPGGGGGMFGGVGSVVPEVVISSTNGSEVVGGRSMRSSPKKGAVTEGGEVMDVEEEERGVQVRV